MEARQARPAPPFATRPDRVARLKFLYVQLLTLYLANGGVDTLTECRVAGFEGKEWLDWTASSSMAGRTTIILAGWTGMIVVG